MKYLHVASRVFNEPLFLSADKAEVIASVVLARVRGETVAIEQPEEKPRVLYAAVGTGAPVAQVETTPRIAVIGVSGSLVHKAGGMQAMSGLRSYTDIGEDVEAAANDSSVRGILLRVDSPGGEIFGSFDAADVIFRAAQAKPVWAIAEDMALSAGYLLASQASRMLMTQSGLVGSIGVVMLHHDLSKVEDRAGVRVTTLYRGARKADFSPHAPLSAEAKEWANSLLDTRYEQFVSAVSRGRKLSLTDIRETEAGVFATTEAASIGLVDGVSSYLDTVQEFSSVLAKPSLSSRKSVTAAATSAIASPRQEGISKMPDEQPMADAGKALPADPTQLRRQIEVEVRTQVQAEVQEIAAICSVANAPNLACGFIADGKSKTEVLAALQKRNATSGNSDVEIDSNITTDASGTVPMQERYNPKAKAPDGVSLKSLMQQTYGKGGH